MATGTPQAAARRAARRIGIAVRSLRPTSVIAVALALLFGATTIADAANGGNFLLGKANTETATATLSNAKGTPLSLSAPAGKAPLAVNQKTMVQNLNSQFTGGLTAGQLQATGGVGFIPPGTDVGITVQPSAVVNTGPLPAGTYYVTATAMLDVFPGDGAGFCSIIDSSAPFTQLMEGGASQEGNVAAAETVAVTVAAGDLLEEVCFTGGSNGSVAFDAGITAIRILSSHPAARTGIPAGATRHGLARAPAPARPQAR